MIDKFIQQLQHILPQNQIIQDELLRYAYSTDASLYRMVPKVVLLVKQESEVIDVIKLATQYDVKLTFRAAGTSLSGQAVTDQVLVMLANDSWLKHTVIDNGRAINLQPGIIGADANKYLKVYKKQIGPDPGSINTAKIGGIIANNSSGMCCGTAKNSYATIQSMRAILSDGSVFDTHTEDSINQFKQSHGELLNAISSIREQVINDTELTQFIRKKFAIKNTSGYSINSFLDFEDPIKILERLMIGSEGTLGFISNVTLQSVPNYDYKALNLVYGKLDDLINLTVEISKFGLSSVELLDYFSIQSVRNEKSIQEYLIDLPSDDYAAIMIEVSCENHDDLTKQIAQIDQVIARYKIIKQFGFIQNANVMATLWKVRGGVLPTVAGERPLGSSVLVEDVAVEIERLAELVKDIRKLFKNYGFDSAAIFGHVLAGNIHFVITPNFNNPDELELYDKFMKEFTDLVARKFNGSLKAEHGSGRNISPFALVEWGDKCWNVMWDIKHLLDKNNIFNPDVKLTKDYTLHMKHLKSFESVDDEINKCMECGFCEPVCPSRKLTLTPRQRNSVARKIASLTGVEKEEWQKKYQYYGIDTCATTGMCQTTCPVGINTGKFILKQKPSHNDIVIHAKEIKFAKSKVEVGNVAAKVIGKHNLETVTKFAHSKVKAIPIYLSTMPRAQAHKFTNEDSSQNAEISLVPACPNRIFDSVQKYSEYPSELILEKIGFKVNYLADNEKSCCGQMYHSSCNHIQEKASIKQIHQQVNDAAGFAIIDNSSCAGFAKDSGVKLLDINEFICNHVDKLNLTQKYNKIALHIDCSTAKHAFNPKYLEVLQKCAKEVVIPEGIKCCGFAGDKGFVVPELNASSLSNLAPQVNDCEIGVTFNRSCQIGLTKHAKIEYISFVELLLSCLQK